MLLRPDPKKCSVHYLTALPLIVALLVIFGISSALATDLKIEERSFLLNPKKIKRSSFSPLIAREMKSIGVHIEERYTSAIKLRLGERRSQRMIKLTSRGQDYCSALRRLQLRRENRLRKAGHRSAQLTFRLNSCSLNYEQSLSLTPRDAYGNVSFMWGLFNQEFGINAPAAWDISTGSSNVVVAVIDTGIDTAHPDLISNLWVNSNEIPGNGIDDDGNGYIDDVYGINAITNSGTLTDGHGHGTHVAGTIGATGDNTIGVTGVNWTASMIGCKFLSDQGSGSTANAIKCVDYITNLKNSGVNIIASNNSWGGGGYSSALQAAINNGTNAGVIFVAAAGNNANNNDLNSYYPAGYNNTIAVAAIDNQGELASFSNYGANNVHIAAPGVSILSSYRNFYAYLSGTSMAAPHVTGVLALMSSVNLNSTSEELKSALFDNAGTLSSLSGKVVGARVLRADTAVLAMVPASPTPEPTPEITPEPSDPSPPSNDGPILEPTPSPTPIISDPPRKDKKKKKKKKKQKKKKKLKKKRSR